MAVNVDCRHYVERTISNGERLQRCKVKANEDVPFACPVSCLFYEPRNVSSAGWQVAEPEPPA